MEACCSATGRMGHVYGGSFGRAGFGDRSSVVFTRPRRVHVGGGGFSDDGHLRYYVRCGGKTVEEKRAKLVKKLSKDLAALMRMEECREGVVGVGETTTKEAADILLAELAQLRAKENVTKREKEEEKATKRMMKKKKKEEEKAMNKMKRTCKQGDMMSSSSSSESSESSDSECDEVVDIAALRAGKSVGATQHAPGGQVLPAITSENNSAVQTLEQKSNVGQNQGSLNSTSVSNGRSNAANSNSIVHPQVNPVSVAALTREAQPVNKIEVCVGGKCKKSGALQLMEEFEKAVGGEGAVVGCKCMGKCKDGPNVRLLNHCNEGDDVSMPLPRDPLCIGVGLEDVEVIIANYFRKNDMGLLTA